MANYSAQDVKKLREETDAPMMECKGALDEADGDYDKAKQLLREKGKAAAQKRAGRSTAAGVVAFSPSADGKTVAAVVVESETDFVARNEDFVSTVQSIADKIRDGVDKDSDEIKHIIEGAVAKIRENIKLVKADVLKSEHGIATYVHHDRTKGSAIVLKGGKVNDAVKKVAVHAVAFPPQVVDKSQLSQERLDAEIATETQRAMNEGKPENIAKNIAQGRVNKEFIKSVVLNEQPFYIEPSKTVKEYLKENAADAEVGEALYYAVGQASEVL